MTLQSTTIDDGLMPAKREQKRRYQEKLRRELGSLIGICLANLADLAPVTTRFTGFDRNPSPMFPAGSPPLLHGATMGATPFRLNLHVGDVGHTLIFGPTGAGKSVLLAAIAAQFRRYDGARVTVFDKGLSMFTLAKAAGGAHYALADETSPGLCPLAFLDGAGDAAWAEEWLATCFELQTGAQPAPRQKQEIHRTIALMRQSGDSEGRTLSDFPDRGAGRYLRCKHRVERQATKRANLQVIYQIFERRQIVSNSMR